MYKNVAHIYVSKSSNGGFEMFKFFQLKTLGGKWIRGYHFCLNND